MTHPTSAAVRVLLQRCGLSQTDAAAYLGKDARTVRRWISGDFVIPMESWDKLTELCSHQDRVAREGIEKLKELVADHGDPEDVTIGLSRTDEEAQAQGYPCVGAHVAVLRRFVEWSPEGLTIVPVHSGDDA